MREKIYRMVHVYEGSRISVIYKYIMIFFIIASLVPLITKQSHPSFLIIDAVCLIVFIVDYILRWITADYKFQNKRFSSFLRYPFRFISIVDMLSVIALCSSVFSWFDGVSVATAFSVFRIVRIMRYSESVRTILGILKSSKKPLIAVGSLAVGYIFISAIIIFNVEPESFKNFFDAVYWATVSLTTVGYGDIYPVTVLGRMVAMISSFFGIAIVALPAGIVTAEYLNSIKKDK